MKAQNKLTLHNNDNVVNRELQGSQLPSSNREVTGTITFRATQSEGATILFEGLLPVLTDLRHRKNVSVS